MGKAPSVATNSHGTKIGSLIHENIGSNLMRKPVSQISKKKLPA